MPQGGKSPPFAATAGGLWEARAEWLLAGGVLLGLAHALFRLRVDGYLPQPFLYDVSAPWIGLHETAFWAFQRDTYGAGAQIYPPLSFVVLKALPVGACYASDVASGRGCDDLSKGLLLAAVAANFALALASFCKIAPATALPRAIAVGLGLPMLFALECGNLIILAFTAFLLGAGGLWRGAGARLALAIAINFKPYLLVLALCDLARRRWDRLSWLLGLSAAIYLATFVLLGAGSPWQILHNIFAYAAASPQKDWSNFYYATSFKPLTHLLTHQSPLLGPPPARAAALVAALLGGLMAAALALVGACLVGCALRPERTDPRRLAALLLGLALTTLTTGQSGYVQIFLFFLLLCEPPRQGWRRLPVIVVYILSVPTDLILAPVAQGPSFSVLSGRVVSATFGVSLGQFARPALLLFMEFLLAALTLGDLLAGAPKAWATAPGANSIVAPEGAQLADSRP